MQFLFRRIFDRLLFRLRLGTWLQFLLLSWVAFAGFDIDQQLLSNIQKHYGNDAVSRVMQWQQLIKTNQSLSDLDKLKVVNDFFNHNIRFTDDIDLWDKKDYWATPAEFLARGAGDCEDYAIAKYFTLQKMGIGEEKMRITYVKAIERNQAHMVLAYFGTPRGVPFVLDNLINPIKPATERKDLIPVYSFNDEGLWLAQSSGLGQRVGDSGRLSLWNDLLTRMMLNEIH